MKKLMRIILVCLLVLGSVNVAAAAEQEQKVEEPLQPQYETVESIKTWLDVSSGTASLSVHVRPSDMTAVDKVVTTVSLIKNSTGESVARWIDVTMKGPDALDYYYMKGQYKLKSRGTYHFVATIKLYKKSVLKETVHADSLNDTY